jgi:hypothetical protein
MLTYNLNDSRSFLYTEIRTKATAETLSKVTVSNVMKEATDRQTDMDGPIICSSITIKRKERIKTKRLKYLTKILLPFYMDLISHPKGKQVLRCVGGGRETLHNDLLRNL